MHIHHSGSSFSGLKNIDICHSIAISSVTETLDAPRCKEYLQTSLLAPNGEGLSVGEVLQPLFCEMLRNASFGACDDLPPSSHLQ